jgi:histidyl-tRNA synthetase
MKINSIKGMHDLLSFQTQSWKQIENLLHNFFEIHGYEEIRTPLVEKAELFNRVIGNETDIVNKEMYSWEDQGGDIIALRPELTAPSVRSYIQHNMDKLNKVTKLYYMGPAFRRERPQKGRQRQFYQYGIESIGSEYPEQDAEVISIAYNIFDMLGVNDLELVINSVGSIETKHKYSKILKNYLLEFINAFSDTSKERYNKNPLRILDSKNEAEQKIIKNAPSILESLNDSERKHFDQVQRFLDKLNIPYKIDNQLVRGLDYYTLTTFEIKTKSIGSQDALCGGGRYNNLVEQLGGKSIPAIGFAAGMERLMMALNLNKEDNSSHIDVFVISIGEDAITNALKICDTLRNQLGIKVRMDFSRSSLKSQMRQANKLNSEYVVILGEEEIKRKIGIIKTMSSGDQFEAPLDTIHKHFDIEKSRDDQ